MTRPSVPPPDYLPALDGLRFIAALLVAASHFLLVIFKVDTQPTLVSQLASFSGLGMTIFFTLSGFVIHYNYHSIGADWSQKNLRYFARARFSRLYPLFFAVIMIDVIGAYLHPHYREQFYQAPHVLPYYLTMTHAWIYDVIGNHSLIYQFAALSSVSWSISVEVFLYVIYLGIAWWLVRMKRAAPQLLLGLVVFAGFIIIAHSIERNIVEINDWGAATFGPVADMNTGYQDSFFRWLIYFSPWVRITEFILGCVTANLIVQMKGKPVRLSSRFTGWITASLFASILLLHFYAYHSELPFRARSELFSPLVALLIYLLARYPNRTQRIMGSSLMQKGGDASYSIYLLQFIVLTLFTNHVVSEASGLQPYLLLKLAGLLALLIVIARCSYLFFERPAKDILRGRMRVLNIYRYNVSTAKHNKLLIACAIVMAIVMKLYDLWLTGKMPSIS